jgi:hypothetical protein
VQALAYPKPGRDGFNAEIAEIAETAERDEGKK